MPYIAIEEHTVEGDGVMLDAIIWRRFQADMPGLLEELLALSQNYHLEHVGPVLPLGTKVFVPVPAPRTHSDLNVISLWD